MEDVENNLDGMNPLNIMHEKHSKDHSKLSNIKSSSLIDQHIILSDTIRLY